MKEEKSFLGEVTDVAAVSIVLLWVLGKLLTTKFGMFLFLTLLVGVGAAVVVGGFINAVAWYAFDDSSVLIAGQWWLWGPCFLIGAVFALSAIARVK